MQSSILQLQVDEDLAIMLLSFVICLPIILDLMTLCDVSSLRILISPSSPVYVWWRTRRKTLAVELSFAASALYHILRRAHRLPK
jgi:hypothetical protein